MTPSVTTRTVGERTVDERTVGERALIERSMGERTVGERALDERTAGETSDVERPFECRSTHPEGLPLTDSSAAVRHQSAREGLSYVAGLVVAALVALSACVALVRGPFVRPASAAAGDEVLRTVRVSVPPHRVDIDRADVGELALLPEVGPGLAARIVANRAVHGAFGSVDALSRVEGIGPARLEAIRPKARASSAMRGPEAGHQDGPHRGDGAERFDD